MHSMLARQLRRIGLGDADPPDREQWRELLEAVSRTYTTADQDRYTLERSIALSSDEMRMLHAALADERDNLHAIINSLGDGLCSIDAELTITFMNPAGRAMFGATADVEIVGRKLSSIPELEQAVARQESFTANDVSFVRTDGSSFSVALALTPIRGGTKAEMVVLFRDISVQKQLEISLRHAQKLESVGRLAAGIAHEINTPIQFIGDNLSFLGSAFADLELMVEKYSQLIAEHATAEAAVLEKRARADADADYIHVEAPDAIKNALEGVSRVSKIVQAMKSLGHNDRGQRSFADLNLAIENTLVIARSEYKYVADVETHLAQLPTVPCYLDDLNQVFLNLIINAAHAIADKVKGTYERGLITIGTRLDGDDVIISIQDSGTGIPTAIQAQIFEPFFTTKEVGRGTGQGLALARAVIVEKHKGQLWFESEHGKGATFFIRLAIGRPLTQDLDRSSSSTSPRVVRA